MARNHLKRKLQTYRSLSSINHHFAAISRHIHILEQAGFLPAPKLQVFRGLVRDMQAQISHDVCDRMHALEDRDCFEFGKVRIAWEHYLNPEEKRAFGQHKQS